jgi:hypothetical protein
MKKSVVTLPDFNKILKFPISLMQQPLEKEDSAMLLMTSRIMARLTQEVSY